jgi:DNA repair protein RadC
MKSTRREVGIDLLQGSSRLTEEEARTLTRARRILFRLARTGPGRALSSPQLVREYLTTLLTSQDREYFVVVALDARHRLLSSEILFSGTIDRASVSPREVVKFALRHNAASLVLSHSHPSGVLEPSQADELLTRNLREALALIDVRVCDHVIVGHGQFYSFAQGGLL